MSAAVRCHAWSRRARLLTGMEPRPRPPIARACDRFRKPPTWGRRLRSLFGWVVLVVGLIGIVMPFNPALLVIPAGVALIGRDVFVIRWSRTIGKLLLRWSATWPGWLGRIGRRLGAAERRVSKILRDRRLGPWSPPARDLSNDRPLR
jgi:hypothetical protein